MGIEDQLIVAFARKWAPFGGPPRGEAFVEFGLTAQRFAHRLREVVTGPHAGELPLADVRAIRSIYFRDAHSEAK